MGRRKRQERPKHSRLPHQWFRGGKGQPVLGAWGEPMPSQRAKMDGDILRRDDAMKLEKPRGKFDVWLDRILGPEGDQL